MERSMVPEVDKSTLEIPSFILEALEPTSSGISKLIAMWDGLSTELQIAIFVRVEEIYYVESWNYPKWGNFPLPLIKKVLKGDNTYLRYLAAKRYHLESLDDNEITALIEKDPEHLVRNALIEIRSAPNNTSEEALEILEQSFERVMAKKTNTSGEHTPIEIAALKDWCNEITQEQRLASFGRYSASSRKIPAILKAGYANGLIPNSLSNNEVLELLRQLVYQLTHLDSIERQKVDLLWPNNQWIGIEPDGDACMLCIRELWEMIPLVLTCLPFLGPVDT
jgi:hypothetical protein